MVIEEQLRSLPNADQVRDDEETFMLLGDLQEAIVRYLVRFLSNALPGIDRATGDTTNDGK